MRYTLTGWVAAALLMNVSVEADVKSASDTHFKLNLVAESPLPPEKLWQRLSEPSSWWHPDHTYSGDAQNLTLELRAGGLWAENWDGGSVEHGRVVLVQQGRMLRMVAPFGPLQGSGMHVIWTISLEPLAEGDGTKVVFEEIASGPHLTGLDKLAQAVDGVKREALERLVDPGRTR